MKEVGYKKKKTMGSYVGKKKIAMIMMIGRQEAC